MAADEYEGLSSTFAAACRKADAEQHRKPADPRLERPHALLDDGVTIERADADINRTHFRGRAAESTVEALMFSLREHGIAAVNEGSVRSRLAQLSEAQLIEIGDRLQRLKPEIARAWSADHVAAFVNAWEEAHA